MSSLSSSQSSNCTVSADDLCNPNGDVAGLGVISATLALAAISTLSSIIMVCTHPSFNKNERSCFRLEGKFVTIMEDTIRSMGITQLVTALALVVSTWITFYPCHLEDPHAAIAISQALLASFSHIAPLGLLLGSGNIGKKSFMARFAVNLLTSVLATVTYFHLGLFKNGTWIEQLVMVMALFSCLVVLLCEGMPVWHLFIRWAHGKSLGRKKLAKEFPPVAAWCLVIIGTMGTGIMFALTIYLKITVIRGCNMNLSGDDGDNDMGFGQWLAIFMLAAVVLSVFEEFTDVKERKSKIRHTERYGQ